MKVLTDSFSVNSLVLSSSSSCCFSKTCLSSSISRNCRFKSYNDHISIKHYYSYIELLTSICLIMAAPSSCCLSAMSRSLSSCCITAVSRSARSPSRFNSASFCSVSPASSWLQSTNNFSRGVVAFMTAKCDSRALSLLRVAPVLLLWDRDSRGDFLNFGSCFRSTCFCSKSRQKSNGLKLDDRSILRK